MKLMQKFMLLSIMLLCIVFTISSISAAEYNLDSNNSTGIKGIFVQNPTDNNMTIKLDAGVYNSSNNNTEVSVANKNITIIGQSPENTIIDGTNNQWLFRFTNVNLTLINISFINGYSTGYGGALYISNGAVTIDNCDFVDNFCSKYGGAIMFENVGPISINNSKFSDNFANENSGAIIFYQCNDEIVIYNSNFINNSAYNLGGAILFFGCKNPVTVINSNFENNSLLNNTTNAMGGGILSDNSDLTVINCNFIENSAHIGGAIGSYGNTPRLNVTDSNFIRNNASYRGGAIYIYNRTAYINNSKFISNTALSNAGGAIYNQLNSSNLNIDNSIFDSNTAATNGGSLALYNGKTNINNSIFTNGASNNGGLIYIQGITNVVTIINSKFSNSKSNTNGGAISILQGTLNIQNSEFSNNRADSTGGAIRVQDSNTWSSFSLNSSKFNNNSAGAGGAIAIVSGNYTSSTIINSEFTNNKAFNHGGAVYSVSINSNISNSTFINNNAEYGGAVWNSKNLAINTSKIFNNSAQFGGAIYNVDGNADISYSLFCNNKDNNNVTLLNNGTSTFTADNNWWGTNNITGMYSGFIVNNHYIMSLLINNVTKYGDKLVITYLLLNNATNTSIGSDLLPLFTASLDYNNKTINIADARQTQNFTTKVNAVNNTLKVYYCNNTVVELNFDVSKANSNLNIITQGNLSTGKNVVFIATLTDADGNPIVGETVDFFVDGVKVGSAVTNNQGIATLTHIFRQSGNYSVTAEFYGNDMYLESIGTTLVEITKNPAPNPNPNNDTNKTNKTKHSNYPDAYAFMKKTGMPIVGTLLVLLSTLGLITRKKQ